MLNKPEKITPSNLNEVLSFLSRYEDTAVFLLGSLNEHGPSATQHLNSGNFKLIRQNKKIICVFCLTRRGNLLVQPELFDPLFEPILESCNEESISIRGFIGDWEFARSFWEFLKNRNVIKKETFYSKEVNYILTLNEWQKPETKQVRLLSIEDYPKWRKDICTVQEGWPLGMPLVRSLGSGLWEVRSSFPSGIARVIFTMKDSQMVLLHGFIKKSQKTSIDDLELAKKRLKNLD